MEPIKNGFTIYQSPSCPFCREAVEILTQIKNKYQINLKNVNLDHVEGGKQSVLNYFTQYQSKYNYNPNHTTRPIIFYNGKFIGGCNDLKRMLSSN